MLQKIRTLRQFGTILLLLVFCVAPVKACLAPDAEMTTEERACCRMMKNQCGQSMEMPASHDCCKKAPKTVSEAVIKTNTITIQPLTLDVALVSSFDLVAPHDAITGWVQRPEHSPPKPPASSITILRI
jgi:hypothetical protein